MYSDTYSMMSPLFFKVSGTHCCESFAWLKRGGSPVFVSVSVVLRKGTANESHDHLAYISVQGNFNTHPSTANLVLSFTVQRWWPSFPCSLALFYTTPGLLSSLRMIKCTLSMLRHRVANSLAFLHHRITVRIWTDDDWRLIIRNGLTYIKYICPKSESSDP